MNKMHKGNLISRLISNRDKLRSENRKLKQENTDLKQQLNQKNEIIEEAIEYCDEYKNYLEYKYMKNLYNTHLLDILKKYKGGNNE